MKDLVIYYFSILLPIPLLAYTAMEKMNILFMLLLFSYVLYRGFTDSQRLVNKGVIEKKDAWKISLIPFYSSKYMKELYFEN